MADYDSDLSFLRASPIGDDQDLLVELQNALTQSVERQVDLLSRSRCDGNWHMAIARLEGLAASFGIAQLADLAEEARQSAPGDPVILTALQNYHATLAKSVSD